MPLAFRWACLAVLTAGLLQTPLIAMQGPPQADPHAAEESAAQRQALGFLGYLDEGRFADSYAYTGMLLRARADRLRLKLKKLALGPERCKPGNSSMPLTTRASRAPLRGSM
jgi:hypothetical protein